MKLPRYDTGEFWHWTVRKTPDSIEKADKEETMQEALAIFINEKKRIGNGMHPNVCQGIYAKIIIGSCQDVPGLLRRFQTGFFLPAGLSGKIHS
jgi:hypothetical protein